MDEALTVTTGEDERKFSGTFLLRAGEPLLISAELAERLPDLIGMSYRDIRSAMGVTTRGGKNAPKMTMTDDGFAVISMIGPVTRYDDWCADLFGGVSTDSLMDQFKAAQTDPSCRGVLFFVDSPGGEAAGIHDLADMIYQARDTTPTVAYVDNLAASAGFWPTTAANHVVVSPASFSGSIGVVTTARKGGDEKSVEVVSSKSPNKRPKVGDPDGMAQIQARIDDLADVFISSVAKHRGVDIETVESDFGQGGVLIGAKAVAAGMADQVGDSNDAFSALRELADRSARDQNKYGRYGPSFGGASTGAGKGPIMAEQADTPLITTVEQLRTAYPSLAAQMETMFRAEGAASERDRIKAIDAIDTPKNRATAPELMAAAKWDGKTTPEALAYQLMQAEAGKTATFATNRTEDAQEIPVIVDAPQGGQDRTSEVAIGKSIAGFINERRGAPAGYTNSRRAAGGAR